MRRLASLLSAAAGVGAVVVLVSACDDPPAPEGGDAEAGVDAGSDGKVDSRPAETPPCHVDCFGQASCSGGVARIETYGPRPCDGKGITCPYAAEYTCARGCASATPTGRLDPAAVGLLCKGGLGDGHTGAACTKDTDCGPDRHYQCGGPDQPSRRCLLFEEFTSPCDPGAGAARCDGDKGVCFRISTETTACMAGCAIDATGSFTLSCAAPDACGLVATGVDVDGSARAFGVCVGHCRADADCATGVCDPAVGLCSDVKCDGSTPCPAWGEAPRACVPDAAGGAKHCRIQFPKKDGEACAPPSSSFGAECNCFAAGTTGVCAAYCTLAADCGAGFTCDPLFPAPTGWPAWPAGLAGRCLRTCTTAGDCLPGLVCDQTAGVPVRTCRPAK